MISLLLAEFWKTNQKILTTNFAAIPNMVDNTFAGPEFNQANGTLSPGEILPFNGFGTMSLEPMHCKGLLGSECIATHFTLMSLA